MQSAVMECNWLQMDKNKRNGSDDDNDYRGSKPMTFTLGNFIKLSLTTFVKVSCDIYNKNQFHREFNKFSSTLKR